MNNAQRKAYADFCAAVAPYDVYDGDTKMNKLKVFLAIYDQHNELMVNLLITNHHPTYRLERRPGYDQSVTERQFIEEATDEVLRKIAMSVLQSSPAATTMDAMLTMLVRAMRQVYTDPAAIDAMVTQTVQSAMRTPVQV